MLKRVLNFDYISEIRKDNLIVICSSSDAEAHLRQLDASRKIAVSFSSNSFIIPYSNDEDLTLILTKLQALGFFFSDAPAGWPPAAVYQKFREEGRVSGAIKTVTWRNPGEPLFGEA